MAPLMLSNLHIVFILPSSNRASSRSKTGDWIPMNFYEMLLLIYFLLLLRGTFFSRLSKHYQNFTRWPLLLCCFGCFDAWLAQKRRRRWEEKEDFSSDPSYDCWGWTVITDSGWKLWELRHRWARRKRGKYANARGHNAGEVKTNKIPWLETCLMTPFTWKSLH